VAELADGEVREYHIHPEEYGLPLADPDEIRGGSPEENARTIEGVIGGEIGGGALSVTLLNAAAALVVAARVASIDEGISAARAAVESGAAGRALHALREASAAV
jgi:anthranilate phosphoribosyltransferase